MKIIKISKEEQEYSLSKEIENAIEGNWQSINHSKWLKQYRQIVREENKRLLETVREEVIGADDEQDKPFLTCKGGLSNMGVNHFRNNLRRQQRAKLNKLLKDI